MTTTQSDTRNEDKQSHKTTVREFLRGNGEVALKDEVRAGTDVPAWYIDQIASTDEFYTSINHNGAYVASKYIIGERGRHDFLWRAFDAVDPDELRGCLGSMCDELLEEYDHAGEFIVIDGTHIAAWANTRDEIENGDVEGASWGKHEGSFYGYKVYLVIDAAAELPVAITMETGKTNDCAGFEPLIDEFEQRYDTDDLQAALADAGFDSQDNRELCQDQLDCPLFTSINPRRSSPLATIKQDIKELFEEHGDEIDTPYDALEMLDQEQLSEYGVEAGNVEETYIFQAIKERMH